VPPVPDFQDLPARPPLPTEQARLRLFEAVGSFLAAIAGTRPVLLVLDDLQWTGPAGLVASDGQDVFSFCHDKTRRGPTAAQSGRR
jgi:hypothetical protein